MERRTTITISLPEQIAQSVERARKRLNMTRSEFFRALLRRELREDKSANTMYVAEKGGSFDFLKDEPELYTLKDVKNN